MHAHKYGGGRLVGGVLFVWWFMWEIMSRNGLMFTWYINYCSWFCIYYIFFWHPLQKNCDSLSEASFSILSAWRTFVFEHMEKPLYFTKDMCRNWSEGNIIWAVKQVPACLVQIEDFSNWSIMAYYNPLQGGPPILFINGLISYIPPISRVNELQFPYFIFGHSKKGPHSTSFLSASGAHLVVGA